MLFHKKFHCTKTGNYGSSSGPDGFGTIRHSPNHWAGGSIILINNGHGFTTPGAIAFLRHARDGGPNTSARTMIAAPEEVPQHFGHSAVGSLPPAWTNHIPLPSIQQIAAFSYLSDHLSRFLRLSLNHPSGTLCDLTEWTGCGNMSKETRWLWIGSTLH